MGDADGGCVGAVVGAMVGNVDGVKEMLGAADADGAREMLGAADGGDDGLAEGGAVGDDNALPADKMTMANKTRRGVICPWRWRRRSVRKYCSVCYGIEIIPGIQRTDSHSGLLLCTTPGL